MTTPPRRATDRDGGETPTDRQRRVWDDAAATYDRTIAFYERWQFPGGREWLASRVHGRVLEVAIGTGLNLAHYPDHVDVTGVELSPAMLDIAAQRAAVLGRDIELLEGDAAALPVEADAFDTVVCALALCSIPDPAGAIDEMRRVLVPGGRLLLLDHVGSTWPPVYAVQWMAEQVSRRTSGEYLTRRSLPLVRAAGFRIEEVERLRAGTVERVHASKTG